MAVEVPFFLEKCNVDIYKKLHAKSESVLSKIERVESSAPKLLWRSPKFCQKLLVISTLQLQFPDVTQRVQKSNTTKIDTRQNVVENSDSRHKQPIEVEYNLPYRYNANKRRFKPQLLNKKRKKIRLNLISMKLLPLRKVRLLIDSSRHNTQSSSSI